MLGFPIRTPPDQRSVANSPGLIAGSNVLLRLLMPRHPPCALHSLSLTNTQQKQQTNNHTHASRMPAIIELVCATKTNTHQHPTQGRNPRQSAYKVCAFLLNKMLASTIQLSTSNQVTLAGQPAQPHPALKSAFRRRGREKLTQTSARKQVV